MYPLLLLHLANMTTSFGVERKLQWFLAISYHIVKQLSDQSHLQVSCQDLIFHGHLEAEQMELFYSSSFLFFSFPFSLIWCPGNLEVWTKQMLAWQKKWRTKFGKLEHLAGPIHTGVIKYSLISEKDNMKSWYKSSATLNWLKS